MTARIPLAILLAVTATCIFAETTSPASGDVVYARDLESGTRIVGLLGLPLGELTSITARFVESGSKEDPLLVEVSEVEGRRLAARIAMSFSVWQWGNLANERFQKNADFRLRVYETGGMAGVPVEAMKETTFVPTVSWGFRTSLVLLYEEK
jgi:hypothetical protein